MEPFLSSSAPSAERVLARVGIIVIEGIVALATFDDARRVGPRATQYMGTWTHSLKPLGHAHITLYGAVPTPLRATSVYSVEWP